MARSGNKQPAIDQAEHIGPEDTGDNIEAKRVVPYGFNGTSWDRVPIPFFNVAYDDMVFSNADSNGNYQTITLKNNSSTVRVIGATYDGNSNLTRIYRVS